MIKILYKVDKFILNEAIKLRNNLKLNSHTNHRENGTVLSKLHYKTHTQLMLSPYLDKFKEIENYLDLPVLIRYVTELQKDDFIDWNDKSKSEPIGKFCSLSLSNNNLICFKDNIIKVNMGQLIEFDPEDYYYLPKVINEYGIYTWFVWMIPHWYSPNLEVIEKWE